MTAGVIPLVFLSGLLGLAAGPVLHHLAVRAGARRPFDRGRPACEGCGTVLPVTRWIGRCPACDTPARRRIPAVAATSAVVLAGTTAVVGIDWTLPAHLVFAAVTVVLVITDVDHKLIPNRILYPGTALAVALLAAGAAAESRVSDLTVGLAAGAGYFLVLLLVAIVARGGFGLGDVKLAMLLGVFTGFAGIRVFLLSVFLTGVYGGIPAIVMLVTRRAGTRDEMPYGPAMILGAWTALAVGDAILRWYTG